MQFIANLNLGNAQIVPKVGVSKLITWNILLSNIFWFQIIQQKFNYLDIDWACITQTKTGFVIAVDLNLDWKMCWSFTWCIICHPHFLAQSVTRNLCMLATLQKHKKLHQGILNEVCKLCNKGYATKGGLT